MRSKKGKHNRSDSREEKLAGEKVNAYAASSSYNVKNKPERRLNPPERRPETTQKHVQVSSSERPSGGKDIKKGTGVLENSERSLEERSHLPTEEQSEVDDTESEPDLDEARSPFGSVELRDLVAEEVPRLKKVVMEEIAQEEVEKETAKNTSPHGLTRPLPKGRTTTQMNRGTRSSVNVVATRSLVKGNDTIIGSPPQPKMSGVQLCASEGAQITISAESVPKGQREGANRASEDKQDDTLESSKGLRELVTLVTTHRCNYQSCGALFEDYAAWRLHAKSWHAHEALAKQGSVCTKADATLGDGDHDTRADSSGGRHEPYALITKHRCDYPNCGSLYENHSIWKRHARSKHAHKESAEIEEGNMKRKDALVLQYFPEVEEEGKYKNGVTCPRCERGFSRIDAMKRHLKQSCKSR